MWGPSISCLLTSLTTLDLSGSTIDGLETVIMSGSLGPQLIGLLCRFLDVLIPMITQVISL